MNNDNRTNTATKVGKRIGMRLVWKKLPFKYKLIIIGVIAAIIIGLNTYSTEMDRYTVKGQTAKEVIEAYCMSINAKDSTLMDDVSYGKQISKQNEGVSSIFVIGKMRQQYGFDSGYEDPAEWFLSIDSEESFLRHSVYGISNLYINDEPCDLTLELKKKKDKPEPVKFENGKEILDW